MPVNTDNAVQCIDCTHFRLKDAAEMGRHGFGLCALSPSRANFPSAVYPRQCAQWREADAQILSARRAWNQTHREAH